MQALLRFYVRFREYAAEGKTEREIRSFAGEGIIPLRPL